MSAPSARQEAEQPHFPCRGEAQAALDVFRTILSTAKGRFRSRVSPVWTHYEDSVFLQAVGQAILAAKQADAKRVIAWADRIGGFEAKLLAEEILDTALRGEGA